MHPRPLLGWSSHPSRGQRVQLWSEESTVVALPPESEGENDTNLGAADLSSREPVIRRLFLIYYQNMSYYLLIGKN